MAAALQAQADAASGTGAALTESQEVLAQLGQLNAANAILRQQLASVRQSADASAQVAANAANMAATATAVPGEGSSRFSEQGVDTRILGKPDSFDGTAQKWRDWSVVVRGYAGVVVADLSVLMEQAEQSTAGVFVASMTPGQAKASKQLYFILLMLCRGQALDRVINSGQGEGLEAWRQLALRYEPRVRSRYAGSLWSC